jgi:biotin carboxyl carrier protein
MKRQIVVNGHAIEIHPAELQAVHEVEPGVYSVLYEGRSYEARVTPAASGFNVEIRGHRFQTEVFDPRSIRAGAKAPLSGGRHNITAAMPGKVVRVLVNEGQPVEAGQGLIVVEAMKMQNEMKAAKPGQVAQIKVRDGDTVAAGDVLIAIE